MRTLIVDLCWKNSTIAFTTNRSVSPEIPPRYRAIDRSVRST